MSYGINFSREMLDVKTNETEFKNVGSLNYTSNMSKFFIDFFATRTIKWLDNSTSISFKGIESLNGLSGKDLINAIDDFNLRIKLKYANGREYKYTSNMSRFLYKETLEILAQEYNPKNGWGSVEGALDLLDEIKEIAIKYPSAVCSVTN